MRSASLSVKRMSDVDLPPYIQGLNKKKFIRQLIKQRQFDCFIEKIRPLKNLFRFAYGSFAVFGFIYTVSYIFVEVRGLGY